jgi:hypothetical protein
MKLVKLLTITTIDNNTQDENNKYLVECYQVNHAVAIPSV